MSLTVIIAVSMVSAIGGLVFNTMPLLVQSLGESLSLSAASLGNLSFAAGLGYLAGTLSGPIWVDRYNWRLSALAVVILASLSFVASAYVSGLMLYATWVGFGFFCALMHALCMRILADTPNPELSYGTRLSVELITISVLLYALPVIFIAQYGYAGAAYGLAAFVVLLGLGAFLMPARTSVPQDEILAGYPSWEQAKEAWIGLGVFLIYLLANVGLWIFLAVIANKFNPEPEAFSLMFSVLKVLGGVAGILGAVVGVRMGSRIPHVLCFVILIAGLVGLWLAPNFNVFMISSWVWEFGFTLGCLYQTAAIARVDPSNKLVVLVTTAFGISILAGGWVAGNVLDQFGASALYLGVAIAVCLPVIFYLRINDKEASVV
jgi:MFS family permease